MMNLKSRMVRKNKKQVINIQNDLNMEKNNQSVDIKSLSKEQRAALWPSCSKKRKKTALPVVKLTRHYA